MSRTLSGILLFALFSILHVNAEASVTVSANSYTGNAFQIGFHEGQDVLRENPHLGMVLKAKVFTKTTPQNYSEAARLIKELDPGLFEEMRGFSEAVRLPLEDVLVKLSGYGITHTPIDRGCTQMALLGERTTTGNTLVGRNYDFSADRNLTDFRLTALYPETSFKASIGMTQFIFGRIEGMNEAGLYAGISFAHGTGRDEKGFFFPIIVRMILDTCNSAEEALAFLRKVPHSCSYNYLIADRRSAFAVETSPPRLAVRKTENGQIVVVNHYISEEMKAQQKWLMPNSVKRYESAMTALGRTAGLEDLKKLLSSPLPRGVCQPYYDEFLGTIWSAVFDLTELKVFYAIGSPDLNSFRTFSFAGKESFRTTIEGKLPVSKPLTRE